MADTLRSGYTTGTHATALFGAVMREYINKDIKKFINVVLPSDEEVIIEVKREAPLHFSTIKVDNDDLDVTKGCCIHVELYEKRPNDIKTQKASLIEPGEIKLHIYAGDGVGVVTKAGLKIEPNFPAINPVPLKMMKKIASTIVKEVQQRSLHLVFSVQNGEEISKQTANEKVGVIGGISILGTRGTVKPISADAYLDSVEIEIAVVDASSSEEVVFTLGNTAHDYANKHYEKSIVIEIGNFIYDASLRLNHTRFKKMVFITSVAKMCKIAQEYKNTHNRFGGINFDEVKLWLKEEIDFDLGSAEYLTLKAVLQKLSTEQTKLFVSFLGYKAGMSFKKWFFELDIDIKNIEIITLQESNVSKRELKW
jgi:cobalt-precorrin-5B (C1)-methyltransferase